MNARLPLLAAATLFTAPAVAQEGVPFEAGGESGIATIAVSGLENPWSMAFLADGDMLVTERPGRLRLVAAGNLVETPVEGVPEVFAEGQGGLLDVALSPDFASDSLVYLSYSEAGEGGAGTAVGRGTLVRDGDVARLDGFEVIFRQQPKVSGSGHFGSRLVFANDGTLFITLGERQKFDPAQDLGTTLGKVVRINADGSIPGDNPFVGQDGVLPEIWSYGHRNPQGATLDADGNLWTIEHGARGGDEVNQPIAGGNYGWPEVSYGTNYDLTPFPASEQAGTEQPRFYWDPSIAPSGLAFYDGDLFPNWQGDLLAGALKDMLVVHLDVGGGAIGGEEEFLEGAFGRIRDVEVAPDGAVWLATDEADGALIRLAPAG
jgi:glucose/arabinose dehydrogenase